MAGIGHLRTKNSLPRNTYMLIGKIDDKSKKIISHLKEIQAGDEVLQLYKDQLKDFEKLLSNLSGWNVEFSAKD